MSAPPSSPGSPALHSLRRQVARHPLLSYLIMAYTLEWATLLPLLLSERGVGILPFAPPITPFQVAGGVIGLALPAFLVAAATGGAAGARDLLGRALRWRVGPGWYLVALLGALAVALTIAVPFLGVAPFAALASRWELLFTAFLPAALVPFLHTNLPEELGWTALQARVQERRGPVLASLAVAPFFALFHLPAYFVAGWLGDDRPSLAQIPTVLLYIGLSAVFAIPFRLVVMWLYNGSGRSLLIPALFHAAFNATSEGRITAAFLPGLDATARNLVAWAAVAAIAAGVAALTRGRLGYRPGRAVPVPAATRPTIGAHEPNDGRPARGEGSDAAVRDNGDRGQRPGGPNPAAANGSCTC